MTRCEPHAHGNAAWPTTSTEWAALASCGECGLALLRVFVRSSDWVVRRVENIDFLDERTVRRRVSVDFTAPRDALSFVRDDGRKVRILPLALMRRKSLVNFDLRDEESRPMPLVGLRQNQALTLAAARAWADVTLFEHDRLELADTSAIDPLLRQLVEGDQGDLETAYATLKEHERGSDEDALSVLARDRWFRGLIDRLAGSFMLLVLDDGPEGARRVVKFSYDEPLTLRYSTPSYKKHTPGSGPSYGSGGRRLSWREPAPLLATLGLTPTLVRFPVPAAELAASFHFHVAAPPQVTIVEASLLAGLPNLYRGATPEEDKNEWAVPCDEQGSHDHRLRRRPSFDSVTGGYPNVDLHVVDVPYGSLSRAQVALQASTAGWLTTAVAATVLATATLVTAFMANPRSGDTPTLLLITFGAAMVAALARPDPHRMITRLLSLVRALAAIATTLTLAGAAAFAFFGSDAHLWLEIFAAVSFVPALLVGGAWLSSRLHTTREALYPRDRLSPWEQHAPHDVPEPTTAKDFYVDLSRRLDDADYPYGCAVEELGFARPAIKVASSEGVRRDFPQTRAFRETFLRRLDHSLFRPAAEPAGAFARRQPVRGRAGHLRDWYHPTAGGPRRVQVARLVSILVRREPQTPLDTDFADAADRA